MPRRASTRLNRAFSTCTAGRIEWVLMERRIQTGRRLPALALLVYTCFVPAYSQTTMFCVPSAVPPVVRSEGVAERMGDILLDCSGGTPFAMVAGNLTVFLSVN